MDPPRAACEQRSSTGSTPGLRLGSVPAGVSIVWGAEAAGGKFGGGHIAPQILQPFRAGDADGVRSTFAPVCYDCAIMNILIAEDDLVSRTALAATLRKWGHNLVVTTSGTE